MKQLEEISLANLLGGGIEERFRDALEQVVANVDDPNTEAEALRKLTVTLTFKPSENRTAAALRVAVETKLPGRVPLSTVAFFGYDNQRRKFVAREHNPKQEQLDFETQRTAANANRPAKEN